MVGNSTEMLPMQLLWLVHGLRSRRGIPTENHFLILYPLINSCYFSGTKVRWHGHLFFCGGIQDSLPKQFIGGPSVACLLGWSRIVADADVNSEEIENMIEGYHLQMVWGALS